MMPFISGRTPDMNDYGGCHSNQGKTPELNENEQGISYQGILLK